MERFSNACKYNNRLPEVIERKLTVYKNSALVYQRHKKAGYKDDMSRMYNELQGIKDILSTMDMHLYIDYQAFTATIHDVNNDVKMNIIVTR